MTAQSWIAGLDIGGTFTDVYMVEPATARAHRFKSLTTPENPARGAIEAVRKACQEAGAAIDNLAIVMHATTLVSNALIERKGTKTALVATRGFADLLEIAREKKYDIYDLGLEKAEPLVARGAYYELTERFAADGSVVEPLDEAAAGALVEAIARSGARAVAVCLSLLLTPSGAETLVFWVSQLLACLVAPKDVPLMTRRGDLKLSHGATAKARETAVKQDRVQTTNAIKSP